MTVALITFVCTFGAALAATFIRGWLPPTHLSKESQDVVRLGIGLVATMTALLLGIVTASAPAMTTSDSPDLLRVNECLVVRVIRVEHRHP